MADVIETDVLIAGGGLLGTTVALDLAYRGVRPIVLEERNSEQVFAARGLPLKVLDVQEYIAAQKYQGFALILVRLDQHIAWRGMRAPQNASEVVVRVTSGASP